MSGGAFDSSIRFKAAISQDTTIRANQAGTGTASDGEAWSTATGSSTNSIVSNRIQVTSNTALTFLQLGTLTVTDGEILARMSASSTNYNALGVFLRGNGSNTAYRARLNTNNSSLGFVISKTIAGTSTNLVTQSITISINTNYWVRFRCIGNNLAAKFWVDGSTEPTAWNLTINDASITGAGKSGLVIFTTTSADTALFDTISVTDAHPTIITNGVTSRLILHATATPSLSLRAKFASQLLFKNSAVRLRSAATSISTFSLRFILLAGTLQSRDLLIRLRLLALSLSSLTSRLRLLTSTTRDISVVRTRIAAIRTQDIGIVRSRIAAIRVRDIGIVRSRIAAIRVRDLSWRIILKPLHLWNLSTRFPLQVFRTKDISARFNIFVSGGNTFATTANGTIFGLGLSGSAALTPTPVGIYAVNGTLLPDTPVLATAPPLQNGTVQVGATFLLLFASPSGTTTSLLANRSFATLTFPLASGDQVSTTVLIASTSGSMFQVICTVTVPVAVNRYVISTQFF